MELWDRWSSWVDRVFLCNFNFARSFSPVGSWRCIITYSDFYRSHQCWAGQTWHDMTTRLDITILVIPLHMEKTQKRYVYKPLDGSTDAVHLEGLPPGINMAVLFYSPVSSSPPVFFLWSKQSRRPKAGCAFVYFRLFPKGIWGSYILKFCVWSVINF